MIPPRAQTAVQNIQATGPFVLLYQLEPKRCVPLEVGHMLLSDGGLFFSEFTNEDMRPSRLRACLLVCICVCFSCVCVRGKEHQRARGTVSESVQQRFTTAAAFTGAGTGEGHPEQNRAYADVPQLWPSARQTGPLPGNESLSLGPYGTRRVYVNHAWPHLVSWIKYTSRSLGHASVKSDDDDLIA